MSSSGNIIPFRRSTATASKVKADTIPVPPEVLAEVLAEILEHIDHTPLWVPLDLTKLLSALRRAAGYSR